ncbi:[FeFe] hydrogenase H-cluster maturation GTPase HydF [Clostridium carnis]
MNSTPNANRKHIALFGKTNAGKSSLLNKILNQEISLVSEKEGTTTDPVIKAMELIPFGPVLFIDTAGLYDSSELGDLRIKRTKDIYKRVDLALYIMEANKCNEKELNEFKSEAKKYNFPYLLIINKIDTIKEDKKEKLKGKYNEAIFVSCNENLGIEELKIKIIDALNEEDEEISLIGDIVPYNGKVILVVPIDSEAPKGRIILPQVQIIRDCLDNGIKSYVVRDTELKDALKDLKDVDLVVTDSQVFKEVDKIVPKNIPLTSFSILFARHKGDIKTFIQGVKEIRKLKPGDKILISESCSHNISHEDIGRVKIPNLLNKYVGGELNYEFRVGHDFPENINEYSLIIHCGACMINRKTVINRVNYCNEKNIPITNYGVVLAFLTGILERATDINY